jgi:hypothetical protein
MAVMAAARRRRWRQCSVSDGDAVTVFLLRGKIPPAMEK